MPDAGLTDAANPAGANPAGQRRARLERAVGLREQGRLDEAEAGFGALLDDEPGYWEALAGLGLCARLRGDWPRATEKLAAALAAAPGHPWVRLDYANILREQGRIADAEPLFRALLADVPGFWQAAAGLGQCLRQRGDLAAAAEQLTAALAVAPPTPWLQLDGAATLRELGRVDAAEPIYRALLAEVPGGWQALAGLGLCLRQRGNLAGAVTQLAAAFAAAPGERSVRLDYANILREAGRVDEAEPLYRGLLADQPDLWPALAGLGLGAWLRGDVAGAAEQLAAALAIAPSVGWLRLEYAATLRELQRIDEAEAVYRAVLADQPASWEALIGLGLCARRRGDRDAAVAHFTAAAEAAPQVEAAWFELANVHREAGRLEDARAVLRGMFARGLAGPLAWFGLGHVERWAGDHAAALEAFRQGFAQFPDWPLFTIEIALDELALGHEAEAERWLLRASEMEAVAGPALIHLGSLARDRQQFDEAVALFRRAAALPTTLVEAHTALAQTLADRGRLDAGLQALDEAERRIGRWPELALTRVSLLRRHGFRAQALAAARQAAAAMPAHPPLWFEWFQNERFAGDAAALEHCLAVAPVVTVHDRAMVQSARGLVAEQRWQLAEAAAAFREAVALNPSLSISHEILARLSLLRFDIPTARSHLQIMTRLRAADQRRQGLSPHLTHTHMGNFFDEFVIDTGLLAALVEAQALAPAERAGRLLVLLRQAPDHTPTAIGLLVALRQAGQFAPPRRDGDGPAIPANIAQYWDQAELPDDLAAVMQSWREHNPGHGYVRFDHASAQGFLRARCTPEVLRAYQRAREPAMKADVFRLAYLFAEGGIYADADDRCLRPLAGLLPPQVGFVACQEHFGTLGNNFLASAPLHPVLGLALERAVQAVNRGDNDMMWLSTGPGLITRAFAATLAMSALLPAAWLERTRILALPDLEPFVATHCELGYKHSARHWLRAAFGQPKAAPAAKPKP